MKLPVLFIGHGTPMNAIEQNAFTASWQALGKKMKPKGILMISAHWYTRGTWTQDSDMPSVINDMYGFPRELYAVNYAVHGDRQLTEKTLALLTPDIAINNAWGIDHGAWSVLTHMYPKRDIPVVQLSIDANKTPEEHFKVGQKLRRLRDEGYLIIGSGNIVHNLRRVAFNKTEGYEWADTFDQKIKEAIVAKAFDRCVHYSDFGEVAKLSVPTTEHFDPLLYVLGAAEKQDDVSIFNEATVMGSLSMTSYIFGE